MINHEGWQADLIREIGAGIVVPPDNADQSARVLHTFLSDPEKVTKAGQAAFQLAKTRFDRDDLAGELLGILQKAFTDYADQWPVQI